MNINRNFDYSDVATLIHEFIHMTNQKDYTHTVVRNAFTEFLSIYFELYTLDFLEQNGVDSNELDKKERLRTTLRDVRHNASVMTPILCFNYFGRLSSDLVKEMKDHFIKNMDEEMFNGEMENLYKTFQNIEEHDLSKEEVAAAKYRVVTMGYRYILGLILAYYARKNCKLEDILYINDHINEFEKAKEVLIDKIK